MKAKYIKRVLSVLMAALITVGSMFGSTAPVIAAEQVNVTNVHYPRPGDDNYSETAFGRSDQYLMSGWFADANTYFWAHSFDSYEGVVTYCIEPGIDRPEGSVFQSADETFWDNYPADMNVTIQPDDIKVLLGRIMQYGYQGNLSLDWNTGNADDADKLSHLIATQILVWETVVGERDAYFNHVLEPGKDAALSAIRSDNPIRTQILNWYNSIVASVQSHTIIPSFMARSSGKADTFELEWDGSKYSTVLTDSNGVANQFVFTSDNSSVSFSVSGNKLTISSTVALSDPVSISATRTNTRKGVITWSDGVTNGGSQDVVTFGESISDPVKAYVNVKVGTGSLKIVKTSEDGKVSGITFTVTGNGVNQMVKTDKNGEIVINDLKPGTYTVTESPSDDYEPQDPQTVTVTGGQTATVKFNNSLQKGNLKIIKKAEDGKVSGISFRVTGKDYDQTVQSDKNGEIVLEGLVPGEYTVTELPADYYEPQDPQTVTVEYKKTATVTFNNELKKGGLDITKTAEDGLVEGIRFHLYGTADNGSTVDEYATTNAKGIVSFRDIPIGTNYTVEEVDTEEKYVVPESQSTPIKWNEVMKLSFDNDLKRGDLQITKTSEDGLAEGMKFHLYGTATNGDQVDLYAVTDAEGIATFKNVLIGINYTVEEVETAARYVVPDAQETPIKWNEVMHLSFDNDLQRGDLQITKTSEDGMVEGVKFHLFGTALNGETVDEYATTDSNGIATFTDILIGDSYTVEEVDTKAWYIVPEAQETAIEWNKVMNLDFENDLKRGDLEVTKTCEDGLVSGIVFHLTGTSDSGIPVDEYATTNENGVALFSQILIGKGYVIEEVDTAIRYVVPDDQEGAVEWNKVTKKSFTNTLKKFRIILTKIDSETGEAQADATLAGAVYGLYKGEDLVVSYTTDENGQFTTDYYPCGEDWTLKEITPSEGYLLDETVYHVGAEPKLYEIESNDIQMESKEDVVKGRIAVIKHCDDGETGMDTPETGAEFEVYLKSAGSFEEADEIVRDFLTCDEYGYAETKDLPYGTYTVHQVSGWDGRELMKDFDVYISGSGQIYRFMINNAIFESYIKVVKKDSETGVTIPYAGAGFQIYDPKGKLVTMTYTYPEQTVIDTFFTTSDGTLITPEKLIYGKGYTLVEVQAPYGYVLDPTPISFDVVEDQSTSENDITLIVVEKTNAPQKGIISIIKTGEVFASVKQTGDMYVPVYEVKGLAGAVYEITAAEDIITPDGTVRYKAGTVVDTITTDDTGLAKSKELYLGKYEIREIKAPYGMVLNEETKTAELVYGGQEFALTETSASFCNERQKVEISLQKAMEKNDLFGIGDGKECKAVKFGLYAAAVMKAADGSEIPVDGLIAAAACDENGSLIFDCDVPVDSQLYVKEIETNDHYILSDETYPVVFNYAGEKTTKVKIQVNDGKEIVNQLIYGTVRGMKVDEDATVIAGATFGLFKANETEFVMEHALMTRKTNKEGIFTFEKLVYGDYTIREIEPAEGFVLNDTVYHVSIKENNDLIEIGFENLHITGTVQVTKVDKDYPENKLTGAEFEVYLDLDGDGKFDTEKDKLVGLMDEIETGVYEMKDLRYGGYFVYEKTAPEGFLKDDGYYYFEIREDGKTVIVENEAGVGFINQARTGKLRIEKTSEDGVLKGFTVKVEGKDICGNVYSQEFVTDEKGQILIEGLRIGDYVVTEVANEATGKYVIPENMTVTILEDKTTVAKLYNKLKPETPDVPKTGDDSNLYLWGSIGLVGLLGIVTASYLALAKKKKEELDNEH